MKHITCLGDSNTQAWAPNTSTYPGGWGVAKTEMWVYRLLLRLEPNTTPTLGAISPWSQTVDWCTATDKKVTGSTYTFYNAGVIGDQTSHMVARFSTDVLGHTTTHCIIMGGTNDVQNGVAPTTTQNNLTSLINSCVSNNITPIACTIGPWTAASQAQRNAIDTLNAWIRSYCAANSISCVDVYSALDPDLNQTTNYPLGADTLHYSAAGHQAIADAFPLDVFYTYVAPTGNDTTGNGSLYRPYKTIGKAAAVVSAGDIVYLRGGTYDERPQFTISGTATNRITWRAYTGETPTITKGFRCTASYNNFHGLYVSPGLPVGTTPGEGFPDAQMKVTGGYNNFYNLKHDLGPNGTWVGNWSMNSLEFYGTGANYNTVDGFDFSYCRQIVLGEGVDMAGSGATGNTVKNGTMHHTAAGFFMLGGHYSTVENVVMHTNNEKFRGADDADAMRVNGNNCTIRGNRVYNIRMYHTLYHTDTIQWFYYADDLLIENNIFGSLRNYGGEDPNDQGQIQFETKTHSAGWVGSCNRVKIRNNVWLSAGNIVIRSSAIQVATGRADNWQIYNNTFIHSGNFMAGAIMDKVAGWRVYNNVMCGTVPTFGTNYAANFVDYNAYVGAKSSRPGFDVHSIQNVGSVANFRFVDSDTSATTNYGQSANWRPQSTSPVRDAGSTVYYATTDAAGGARTTPDIGAYEYVGEAQAATATYTDAALTAAQVQVIAAAYTDASVNALAVSAATYTDAGVHAHGTPAEPPVGWVNRGNGNSVWTDKPKPSTPWSSR